METQVSDREGLVRGRTDVQNALPLRRSFETAGTNCDARRRGCGRYADRHGLHDRRSVGRIGEIDSPGSNDPRRSTDAQTSGD